MTATYSTQTSRETNRDNQASPANQTKPSPSATETGKGTENASGYASRRATNYASLYKLPSSTSKSSETPAPSNYSTSSGWTGRTYGRNGDTKSVARSSQAPSESNDNNFLSPYSAGYRSADRTPESTSPTPSYSPSYSRSVSRDKTPDNAETVKPEPLVTSISSLPRTFRAYSQRSATNAPFESPSTYTPRTPAYGRTATREIGYSSTLPAPRASSNLSDRLPVMSKSAELPSIEIKEHSPDKEKAETSGNSSEEDDSRAAADERAPPVEEKSPGYVISRGTSPGTSGEAASSVSALAHTPRSSSGYLKSMAAHEVQTDELERPKVVGSSSLNRSSPYSNRYYGRYTSPSRKMSPAPNGPITEEKKSVKDPSPPISALSKPPIPIGCKEYRKSPLNVDLDDQQANEFRKRQEEFRDAQRRAKRQARKSSGGSTSASPGPADRVATPGSSRRNSLASEKSSSPKSAAMRAPQIPAIVRNASRKKVPSISSMMNSSRSSSCSSSASSASRDEPSKANSKSKAPLSNSGSNNRLSVSRKGSTSSESGNRMRLSASRLSSGPSSPPVIPRPPSGSKSRSPSVAKSQTDRSESPQVPATQSRSQSRSPSVNWSLLLKMTRGPLDRSSTSPESLPSRSSGSQCVKNASGSRLINRSPDGGPASTAKSLRGSSGSLPPHANGQGSRSGRTTASSSRSHIPSRNASARSIARVPSSSTDSSTSSTGSERVKHSRSASRVKDPTQSVHSSKRNSIEKGEDSSFAAKIASSFSWLRRQNSDVAPWWLPSTDDVPALADAQEPQEESSTSSSSSSKEQQQQEPPFNWIRRQNSDVTPWWLQSNDDVPAVGDQSKAEQAPEESSTSSSSSSKEKREKVRRQDSEVVEWWLPSTDDVPALVHDAQVESEVKEASDVGQAPSYGRLRKQNSDLIPWWLPSTDNVPGLENGEQQAPQDVVPAPDDTSESTSSADETQTSSDVEDESETSDDKRDDTDVEVEDLPDDPCGRAGQKDVAVEDDAGEKTGEELGDRSSPDGFEWPDCPPTPPMIRSYPFYRRPASPYDNVDPSEVASADVKPMSMHTTWGMDALRALDDPDVFGVKRHPFAQPDAEEPERVMSDGKETSQSKHDDEETGDSEEESDEELRDARIDARIDADKSKETEEEKDGESEEEESEEEESDGAEQEADARETGQDSKLDDNEAEESDETEDSSDEESGASVAEQNDAEERCSRKSAKDAGKAETRYLPSYCALYDGDPLFAADGRDREEHSRSKEKEVRGSPLSEDRYCAIRLYLDFRLSNTRLLSFNRVDKADRAATASEEAQVSGSFRTSQVLKSGRFAHRVSRSVPHPRSVTTFKTRRRLGAECRAALSVADGINAVRSAARQFGAEPYPINTVAERHSVTSSSAVMCVKCRID